MLRSQRERGSAAVESIFGVVFVAFLALGVIEIALGLYARNVVISSTHEGARAVIESGATGDDARSVARSSIARSAGDLVRGLEVSVLERPAVTPGTSRISLMVTARLHPPGPIPISLPIETSATATKVEGVP